MEPVPFDSVLLAQFGVVFHPLNTGIAVAIFIVILLLIGSALISGSEVAYFYLSPADKQILEEKGSKRSRLVLTLINDPERLLGTILISNNFINISIVILSSFIMNQLMDFGTSKTLQFIIQVVVVAFVLLLFGEILPKLYANLYAMRFSLFMALPLKFAGRLLYPVSSFLIFSTSLVNKRLVQKRQNISMDDLSEALELTSEDITEEKTILEGIIKFGNIDAREIMKSRLDVVSVDINTNLDELIRVAIGSGYSRIPIYKETLDAVKGILYIKDLLPHIRKGRNFKWQSLIRPPYLVPENKKIGDLLNEFQTKKIHLAIVVDEYGGTSGIITLEDIIEEIVGEIYDESDEHETFFEKLNENEFLFKGKVPLNDFFKIMETDDDIFNEAKGDADTLAGFLLELKGEFPEKGEKTRFKNFEFVIEALDHRRIKQIRVIMHPVAG